MFQEALQAARAGDRLRARDLLTRLLKERQDQVDYWIWMSAVVETSKERIFCLKEALRLDPQNLTARRGLVILGAMEPDKDLIVPVQLQKRNWQSSLERERHAGVHSKGPQLPKYQITLIGVAVVALIGLVALVVWGANRSQPAQTKRANPLPAATITQTAEFTPTAPRPTPSGGVAQLWELLDATYTPTPLYVNTPHPLSEAYRIGLRALQREDWQNAGNYFRQAATDVAKAEPEAVDVLYYVAENARLGGNLSDAIEIYNEILRLSPSFAPAYLGRARAVTARGTGGSLDLAISDLENAVKNDPKYEEALLELAALQIQSGRPDAALKTLGASAAALARSPLAHLYRAQAQLHLGDFTAALVSARQANNLDLTLLPAYKIIGETLQASGETQASLEPLITYTTYVKDDPQAWAMLANAHYFTGQQSEALAALNRALQLDSRLAGAYLMRAEIALQAGDAENALDDFETALRQDATSYEASLGIGRALMALDYPGDAWDRFERTRKLAETDLQKAELTYWRAQSLEQLGELSAAMRDYQALVDLPSENVKEEWIQYAREHMQKITALTPTVKPRLPSPTITRTSTRLPSRTPTPTLKP